MTTNIDRLEAEIETFTDASPIAREIAQHLIAKGWKPPVTKNKYRRVSDADNAKVGDLVRSKWGGSSGAVWRVVKRTEVTQYNRRNRGMLELESVTSGRTDERFSNDLDVVEVVSS